MKPVLSEKKFMIEIVFRKKIDVWSNGFFLEHNVALNMSGLKKLFALALYEGL